jgi:UPF0271 protein
MVCLYGSEMTRAAEEAGLYHISEIFADRAYNEDGSLVPRNMPGAVIDDIRTMTHRLVRMVSRNEVISITGKMIPVRGGTVCIHGDNESAPGFVKALSAVLSEKGINLKSFGKRE